MDNKNKETTGMVHGEEEAILLPATEEEALFAEPERGSESLAQTRGQTKTVPGEKQRAALPGGDEFRREVAALLKQHPELMEQINKGGELPREVIAVCAKNGVPLRAAFAEYELKQAKAEIERLRKENKILKQNAAAAAKGPVKGAAAGGSTETKGKDPFLEGLLSDD